MLDDGVNEYTYDPANRLTSWTDGVDTYGFTYNGLGDRMQQTVNSETTTYVLDLNAGLTQVLHDGQSSYVYGYDLVSFQTGTLEQYPLRDALGSVRQLTEQSSAITMFKTYEPYGSVQSVSGEEEIAHGFAGEWTDGTGLQYLRARYYASFFGGFVTKGSFPGSITLPSSFNGFSYAFSNPVNFTDPTGQAPPKPTQNHHDLTSWLLREMQANRFHPRVQKIRGLINLAAQIDKAPMFSGSLMQISQYPLSKTLSTLLWGLAANEWRLLVQDGARWDFKDAINLRLGRSITLCGASGCDWYEFSTPGNIHYGYVGAAAGFSPSELHLGASYAEITDPAHRELVQ